MKYINDIIRASNYSTSACQRDNYKLQDLLKVYLKVFGENLKTSCGSCIDDGIIRLQIELRKYNLNNKLKQEIMEEQERKYVMTPNSVIDMAYSTGEYFTPNNMTDEKARKLIKRNPAYLKWFVKYPKDEVAKLIGKKEEPKKEEPKVKPTGKLTIQKDEKPEGAEGKKIASPASIEILMRDNSKKVLLEKAKDIPNVNVEMDKAVIAKMILEA